MLASLATTDYRWMRAHSFLQQTKHFPGAYECEAYEGALQSIEDVEHIPKHGQVDQQCDEAEHPRQTHDRRQLDVETELVSIIAADALRFYGDQTQVLHSDAE